MKSWKTPTPEEVSRAVALLGRAANYRHFFENLENPLWIQPLQEKEFFKTPPAPEYEDSRDGRIITFPRWPESRYLARMARHAPDLVTNMLLGISHTDNIEVREDIVRAALAMPADLAARFVNAAKQWITGPFFGDFLAMRLGELASHLANGGKTDAALRLTRELLQVQPRKPQNSRGERPSPYDFPSEPVARFGTWQYEQILDRVVPPLVDGAGFDAIAMLCDHLEEAVRIKERHKEGRQRVDFSDIWRPAIEDHEQNRGNTVMDALISSLRDSVERLCSTRPESTGALVELLEKREWPVFRRIGMYILGRFVDKAPKLVEQHVADEALFDDYRVLHEYYHLCRLGFAYLSSEAKEKVLGWIRRGLERETVEELIRSRGKEPTDHLVDKVIDKWRLDRLTPMKGRLTGEWAEYYGRLVDEMGEPEHPDFSSWHETKGGHDTPLTSLEIRSMPIASILAFMRTWEPSESLWGPSAQGLGRVFEAVVALHPRGFAALAKEFIEMEPTYVRSLLSGLESAVRSGLKFDWRQVLALCEWVTQQPINVSGKQPRSLVRDPDWGWTRGQIADLFSEGFNSGRNTIPFEERSRVWRILEPLTNDPYPTFEGSQSPGDDARRDPAMDSWNTTRGKAMRSVIQYAVWVRERTDEGSASQPRKDHGLNMMPEVRSILEAHLDVNLDPNPPTRSVYGQWLPALVWLDKDWVASNLDSIFPPQECHSSLWKATWDGYVTLCRANRSVFELLRNQYRRAIDAIARNADASLTPDPDYALAEHLMTVYWAGGESMESEDSLIREFFEKAPSRLQEHALSTIGSYLTHSSVQLSPDIAKRLTDLWEWRRDICQCSETPKDFTREVAQFGLWFVSGKLDERWALEQLLFAIGFSDNVDSEHDVVERLASLAHQFPLAVADCLDAMVAKVSKLWRVYAWHEPAFAALRAVIESGHPEGAERARKVANRFGELGFRDFKILVSSGKKG